MFLRLYITHYLKKVIFESFDQTAQVAESRVIGSEIEFILKKMMGDP